MNPFRLTTLTTIVGFCAIAGAQAQGRIHWETDFSKALKEAKASGKYLLVDFYSDRVYWSLWLNTYTYTDDRVVNLSKQFIPVRLDDRKANDAISVRYGVTGCPTVLFIDGDGKALASGYGAPGDFSVLMKQVLAKKDVPHWKSELSKNPNDPEALVRLGVLSALAAATVQHYRLPVGFDTYATLASKNPRLAPPKGYAATALAEKCAAAAAKIPNYDFSELYLALGDMYQSRLQYDRANEYFDKVIKAGQPTSRVVYAMLSKGACEIAPAGSHRNAALPYIDRAGKIPHLSKDDLQTIRMFREQTFINPSDKVTAG